MGDAVGDSELEKTIVSKETNQNQTAELFPAGWPSYLPALSARGRTRKFRKSVREPHSELFFVALPLSFALLFVLYGYPSAYESSPGTKSQGSSVPRQELVDSRRPPDWQDVFLGVVSPAAS